MRLTGVYRIRVDSDRIAKLEQAAEALKQLPIITLIDPTEEQYAQAEADYLA